MNSDSQTLIRQDKLGSAIMLVDAIECLDAPLHPVSLAAVSLAGVEAEIDRQRLSCAWTRLVLSALTVELVFKHAWENAHPRQERRTHDIQRLYTELAPDIACSLQRIYEDCLPRYISAVQKGRSQGIIVDASPATFNEALVWNKLAVRDLKYEMALPGKFVPYGIFWGAETIWIPSPDVRLPNFAVELVGWAMNFYSQAD